MSDTRTQGSTQEDHAGLAHWNSGVASDQILFRIARQCKGVHPAVDTKIDSRAALISGKPNMSVIPGRIQGEPVVPLVLNFSAGRPTEEASWSAMTAVLNFCSVTGLNFVHNAHPDLNVRPVDFCYFDLAVNPVGHSDMEQELAAIFPSSLCAQLDSTPFALIHLQLSNVVTPQLGDALLELATTGRFNSVSIGRSLVVFSQPETSDALDGTRCFSALVGA